MQMVDQVAEYATLAVMRAERGMTADSMLL
jgi:hypothetical protein